MHTGAREFVRTWVKDNVRVSSARPQGNVKAAKQYAYDCARAANVAGIKEAEIEKQLGNLIAHMNRELTRIISDKETQRVPKDS